MLSNYSDNFNSLEKKLYQLIIHRLDGGKIETRAYQEEIFEYVRKGIGGFILFGGKKNEVKHFIHTIQSRSEIPLFMASDIERGTGQQVEGTTLLPCQMAMAAALDKERPEERAILAKALEALSHEAHDIGINMPLIPVLDINQNPDNPIICTRAFSDNLQTVMWFGAEYVKGLERSGLISCAKHFPGHGDTTTDSHITLPVINKSYKDLLDIDIVPFKEAIKTGVSSIMLGHLSIPAIDAQPSTLSRKIITDILRGELDFKGLVMTDALNMHALKDIEKVAVKCMNAGIDILLHPVDVDLTVQELIAAVKNNELSEALIDDAVSRIVTFKKNMALTERKVHYEEHEKLSSQISDMSVTVIKNTESLLPLSQSNGSQLIFAGDSKHFGSSPLKKYFKHVSKISDSIDLKDKTAICAIFTSVAAWVGSSGIDEAEKDRVKELLKKAKHSVVISFGSPYVLRYFKEADVLIAAYEPTVNAQEAALKCLKGEIRCNGTCPVRLEFQK
jgi:beta-glucosidase-like glycosyl hydrolase